MIKLTSLFKSKFLLTAGAAAVIYHSFFTPEMNDDMAFNDKEFQELSHNSSESEPNAKDASNSDDEKASSLNLTWDQQQDEQDFEADTDHERHSEAYENLSRDAEDSQENLSEENSRELASLKEDSGDIPSSYETDPSARPEMNDDYSSDPYADSNDPYSDSDSDPYYETADYDYYDDYNDPNYDSGYADNGPPEPNSRNNSSSDYPSPNDFADSNGNVFDVGGPGQGTNNSIDNGIAAGGGGFFRPDGATGSEGPLDGSSSNSSSNDSGGLPVDTFDFSNIGGGAGGAAQGSSTGSSPPSCVSSRSSGTYYREIGVDLSCNQSANIQYCVGTETGDGSCCDPRLNGTDYTGTIDIGEDPGKYCVSYIGRSITSALFSNVSTVTYNIDSALPVIETSVAQVQLQSTQLPLDLESFSLDYGRVSNYLSHINTKDENPVDLGWSCYDILNNYAAVPGSDLILNQMSVNHLSPEDQINQSLTSSELSHGDNYISTILDDRLRELTGCQTQNIRLEDFPTFTFPSTSPRDAASEQTHFSGFVPYGHFQPTPNSSESGSGKSPKTDKVLEQGFLAITH